MEPTGRIDRVLQLRNNFNQAAEKIGVSMLDGRGKRVGYT
jgi:hypothetical protein